MFEGLKKAFKENVEPLLPPSVQRLVNDTRQMRDLPGGLIQDGQEQFEQMLNASPLGQKALEDLLNNKKKHVGRLDRGLSIIIEISDERQDHMTPARPDEVRALSATHLARCTNMPGKLRICFTPKPPAR